jgi:Tfp pilus assembly protein PilV
MFRIIKNQRGWILIDSLIGLVILSIAITALSVTFTQAIKGILTSDNRTKAAYLANEQLTQLKVHDGQQQDRNSIVWRTTNTLPAEQNHNTVFTVTTAVLDNARIPANLHIDVIPVEAVVNWVEPTGANQLQIVTYYYFGMR